VRVPRPTTALMSVYAGVATERERELVRQYIEGLITAIAAATARAEAAEATIELRDEQLVVARDVEKYLRRHIETAERERDEWQRRAEQWKARWEHDSPDAYNARINEAMRHLTQQSEAHL